jgi:hypothetical protein
MQKSATTIVIILLAVLVAFECLKLTKASEAIYQPVYDYNIVYLKDSTFEEDMKTMGNEGWEIVNARRASSGEDTWGYECIIKKTRLIKKK